MKKISLRVYPSRLEGSIKAPPGKSLMQRAIVASILSGGETLLANPCLSEDCLAMLKIAEQLGYTTEMLPEGVLIKGMMQYPDNALSVGESGLGARLIMPIAALYDKPIEIIGTGTLLKRPMHEGIDALKSLGAILESDRYLPLTIQGPIQGGELHISGEMSSQFLSGLLMALPKCKQDSIIHCRNLQSKPYVDLTLEVMQHFGIQITHENYELFHIKGRQYYKPSSLFIDGDWSSGAALMVAGAVAGSGAAMYTVMECGGPFTHADSAVTGALLFAGCKIAREEDNYTVKKGKIRGFSFDASDCPDLFPVLAALAVFADKPSTLKGIHRLAHKESNRAESLKQEFAKCGIKIELKDDEMIINPGPVKSALVNSQGDHRIAMALAILALGSAPITIEDADCVSKSYPEFWSDLQDLGADIRKV